MKKGLRCAGRYEVGELLGSGSMGQVFAARDIDGTPVAIKFLHASLAANPEMRERFEREAVHARKIRSPYVARIVGAGPSGKGLWIAYQQLFGETLDDCLRARRCLDAPLAGAIFEHVLQGLQAAHDVGVLHRDIKPSNVFLERLEGLERTAGAAGVRACILDFGLSKFQAPPESSVSSQGLTGTADMLGSVRYMAPEQIRSSADVDARADLYAAAVVLYRMLSGAMPFASKSAATMLVAKLNDRALPIAKVTGVRWPAAVEAFFRRMLAPDPDERFASAIEVLRAWREAVARVRLPEAPAFDAEAMRDHDPEDFQHERSVDGGSTVEA